MPGYKDYTYVVSHYFPIVLLTAKVEDWVMGSLSFHWGRDSTGSSVLTSDLDSGI